MTDKKTLCENNLLEIYVLFSNVTSHYCNWVSVAKERRRGRCGNLDGVVGNGDGLGVDRVQNLFPCKSALYSVTVALRRQLREKFVFCRFLLRAM